MKFQKPTTPKLERRCEEPPAPPCPLLGIARINRQGMVLEMRHGFEVGSGIVLGFHLQDTDAATGHAAQGQCLEANPQQPADSCFIGVEAIVIESKPGSSTSGEPAYLVTVLFSQISRADKEKLLDICRSHRANPRQSLPPTMSHGGLMQDYNAKLRRKATQRIHWN